MSHETELIVTIAAAFALAFVFGLIAIRFRLPPLVGYLLAGVAIGPFTPGYVADIHLARQLAEIGVVLLMFGVGIHFSFEDLLASRRLALPGAIVQILITTVLGALISHLWWGWDWGAALVLGLCLFVASTVVLLRALEDRSLLHTDAGRIAVGWLIFEDIATVLLLVVLPGLVSVLGGESSTASHANDMLIALGIAAAKVGAFVLLMVVAGRRAVPWLLRRVVRTGSRELFTLAVLTVAIGIAVGAAAF
jgi:CPA2 family monovalent cation:H+ antiporter-2